ncbi:MAG TPA: hypothetical protein VEG30_16515 [Terriglobales bacterium]|nr:hypothetical protein [Terriglobales bacterium]
MLTKIMMLRAPERNCGMDSAYLSALTLAFGHIRLALCEPGYDCGFELVA